MDELGVGESTSLKWVIAMKTGAQPENEKFVFVNE